jgi:hypothetical protein
MTGRPKLLSSSQAFLRHQSPYHLSCKSGIEKYIALLEASADITLQSKTPFSTPNQPTNGPASVSLQPGIDAPQLSSNLS